jgi:hypothetical protein
MISVDTDVLKQLASLARTSNDEINAAVSVLNQVTTHNDWGCKERTQINEYITENKTKMKRIQESSSSFFKVITDMSNEFESVEKGLPSLISDVDSILGDIISIPTISSSGIGKKTSEILSKLGNTKTDTGSTSTGGVLSGLTSAINTVLFKDLKLSGDK